MPEPTRSGIHPQSDADGRLLQREIEWALGQARALAEDRALAKDRAGPLARALERVLEQALERARGEPLAKMLTWAETRPPFTYTYGQILADSKLKDIIDCIGPKHHHGLACALSQDPFALQEVLVVNPNYYSHQPPSTRLVPTNFPYSHRQFESFTLTVDACLQTLVYHRHGYLGITQAGDNNLKGCR